MKRILWVGAILIAMPILALAALVGRAILDEFFPNEGKIWELIETRVSSLPIVPREELYPGEWRTIEMVPEMQTGYLQFADGEVWRYCFASYHSVPGTNSFSIYKGASETWRMKGSSFCCEIFPSANQPRNAEEFRAMLKKTGDTVGEEP